MMALTPAHLAKVARDVPETPSPYAFTPLSDTDFEEVAHRLLDEIGTGPFWIFAISSLIWKPAFEYVEARRSVAHGWRRSFCLEIKHWRATPEQPGLMLALRRGGACTGVAYRMPDDEPHARMIRLLRREMEFHEGLPWLRWLNVRAGGQVFRALAFYCAPSDDPDVVTMTDADQAVLLARAAGYMGSCAEYLHNTVSHLEALGIHDRYLWALQARVAAEIDRL